MKCQMITSLGVYVLGAAEAAERRRVEAHLPRCPWCRAELIRLAPIPGLLASIPQDALPRIGVADGTGGVRGIGSARPQSVARGRRARIARLVTALAAAAAATVAVLLGGSGPAAPGRPAALMLTGMNPATHIRVTAAMTPTSWGTSIRLTIRGAPLNAPCRLVVRSRAGGTETAGVWDAWREGPITVPASAGWRLSDIASLQLMAGASKLVTIRTARPASVRVRR